MKNDSTTTASDASLEEPGRSQGNSRPDAFTMVLFTVFIVGGISLYLVRPASSAESVTVRCERSAVIAAGEKRNFRKEKKLAFERCMDESFQTSSKPGAPSSGKDASQD